MQPRESLPSWQKLSHHADFMKQHHMKQLFAEDKQRFNKFSIQLPSMLLDYSKNVLNQKSISLLVALAQECDIEAWREKMFQGDRINFTEDRAVLHTALRNRNLPPLMLDGENISIQVQQALAKMKVFSEQVRQGQWLGYSGKRITDIVSIGVGGSNLGPQMVTEALKKYSDNSLKVHYVSNVDGTQIAEVLRPLNPESVLFIVSSKTFTTTETMTNARTAVK